MQELIAGMAIGSIATGIIGLAWHRAATANLRMECDDWEHCEGVCIKQYQKLHGRLFSIANHFKNQKSGTARLVVKMCKGEV